MMLIMKMVLPCFSFTNIQQEISKIAGDLSKDPTEQGIC